MRQELKEEVQSIQQGRISKSSVASSEKIFNRDSDSNLPEKHCAQDWEFTNNSLTLKPIKCIFFNN